MIELAPHGMAHGGEAVARRDGKTYFVSGAIPGETVGAELVQDKGSWARARLVTVGEPSADRVEPPCPHFAQCGGCQWQFASHAAQLRWKREVVAGQLAHLGGVPDAEVRETASPGPAFGYRNRMDFRVERGRPALFRPRSRELVALDECLLLHPLLADLFDRLGSLDGAQRITLRCGARTGDLMAVVSGGIPAQAASWGASVVRSYRHRAEVIHGDRSIREQVAGRTFRITAGAFFQNNTEGAEALVSLATEAARVEPGDVVLDAYAGGGLFSATVAAPAERVIAVEVDGTAVSDLRRNLENAGRGDARIVRGIFEEVAGRLDDYWTIAVVDPPRTGLGEDGVAAAVATMPHTVVYVSCDPASLARDTYLLTKAGYRLDWAAPVDMFPQTFHVETVARFVRREE